MNVEQHARQQSVIAIHDRPDLAIVNVAAKPTGLGVVTGLDPANRTCAHRTPLGFMTGYLTLRVKAYSQ